MAKKIKDIDKYSPNYSVKTSKELEQLCGALIEQNKPLMFLHVHDISFSYDPDVPDEYVMWCEPKYPYLDAKINYGEAALEKWESLKDNPKELKKYFDICIIHEMEHIHTDELHDKAKQRYVNEQEIIGAVETLVDTNAKIIYHLKQKAGLA